MYIRLSQLAAAAAGSLLLFSCSQPHAPYAPGVRSAAAASATEEGSPLPASAGLHHFEYVVGDAGLSIFDQDNAHALARTVTLPQLAAGVRGVAASPVTGMLYISYGGDGGPNGVGSLLEYDLVAGRVVWTKSYSTGIDSMAVSPDGKTIYMPDGELSSDGVWHVIDASSGAQISDVNAGKGPHNTIVSTSGNRAYLGGRWDNHLQVLDTAANKVIQSIGPLKDTVRPFTINGQQSLAYVTVTGFLGFQVGDIATGRVLHTVGVDGFTYDPKRFAPSAPSHGISLSPDEKELYLIDAPNGYVHVYDVTGLPSRAPAKLTDIRLQGSMTNRESPCAYDCDKDGWLQHSRDGRFVYVGDAGDVIDTAARTTVAVLEPLANTRKFLEVDFQDGRVVDATPRSGVGYLTS